MTFERTFPTNPCIAVVIVGGLLGLFLLFWVLPRTMRMFRRELDGDWMDAALVAVCIGFLGAVCLSGSAFAGSQLTDQPNLTATVPHWRTIDYTPGELAAPILRRHCPQALADNELAALVSATRSRYHRRHPLAGSSYSRHAQPLKPGDRYTIDIPADCYK